MQLDKWIELNFGIHDKWCVYWMGEFLYVLIIPSSIENKCFESYNTVSVLGSK